MIPIKTDQVFPKARHTLLKYEGWGYKDSYFYYDKKKDRLFFSGSRYPICKLPFDKATQILKKFMNVNLREYQQLTFDPPRESEYIRLENPEFVKELTSRKIEFSFEFMERFYHCHGQGAKELNTIRTGKFDRIPDIVIWPSSHEDVEFIVALANKFSAVIVPYAGGTNTTNSLIYSNRERYQISLDMTLMNKILWIDDESMLVCVEAGCVGKAFEDALNARGFTMGHEPDSLEFSTVGGWVATRSSGMKQQTYGNIEDMVNRVTLVTGIGTMEKNYLAPRASIGPDLDQIAIGSEGTLGVITKIVMKIHPKPEVRNCGSFMFHNFENGVAFLKEVSQYRTKPSSLRLVDSVHFEVAEAFNQNSSIIGKAIDGYLKWAGTFFYDYQYDKCALATYLIEGKRDEVKALEKKLAKTAWKYYGYPSGAKYGERGYTMTFSIAYMRDLFFDVGIMGDSVEPSVSWGNLWRVINTMKEVWTRETTKLNVTNFLGFRISQIYYDGVCLYIYYSIGPVGAGRNQFEIFDNLYLVMRAAMLDAGASLSHHHGIGKKGAKLYPKAVSQVGLETFKAIKAKLDPNNVFDAGNIFDASSLTKL